MATAGRPDALPESVRSASHSLRCPAYPAPLPPRRAAYRTMQRSMTDHRSHKLDSEGRSVRSSTSSPAGAAGRQPPGVSGRRAGTRRRRPRSSPSHGQAGRRAFRYPLTGSTQWNGSPRACHAASRYTGLHGHQPGWPLTGSSLAVAGIAALIPVESTRYASHRCQIPVAFLLRPPRSWRTRPCFRAASAAGQRCDTHPVAASFRSLAPAAAPVGERPATLSAPRAAPSTPTAAPWLIPRVFRPLSQRKYGTAPAPMAPLPAAGSRQICNAGYANRGCGVDLPPAGGKEWPALVAGPLVICLAVPAPPSRCHRVPAPPGRTPVRG